MEKIFVAAMFQTVFSYTAAIVCNICLCHDLIYCLRDPLCIPEGRYTHYKVSIFLSATIAGIVRVNASEFVYGYLI